MPPQKQVRMFALGVMFFRHFYQSYIRTLSLSLSLSLGNLALQTQYTCETQARKNAYALNHPRMEIISNTALRFFMPFGFGENFFFTSVGGDQESFGI
jgi:hypothetical protein